MCRLGRLSRSVWTQLDYPRQGFLQARLGGGRLPPPPPKKISYSPPKFLLTLFLFTLSPLPLGYSPHKVLQLPPPQVLQLPPPPKKKGEILQETFKIVVPAEELDSVKLVRNSNVNIAWVSKGESLIWLWHLIPARFSVNHLYTGDWLSDVHVVKWFPTCKCATLLSGLRYNYPSQDIFLGQQEMPVVLLTSSKLVTCRDLPLRSNIPYKGTH